MNSPRDVVCLSLHDLEKLRRRLVNLAHVMLDLREMLAGDTGPGLVLNDAVSALEIIGNDIATLARGGERP